jgi:putative peptidoglycan lipid II flippase
VAGNQPPALRRFAAADAMVAAGILISRLAGLARTRIFSHYFGQRSLAADAFNAAFRIPNLLQNLFGEGALSGSFIPVYAGLRTRGEADAAAEAARTFFALLSSVIAVLVLVGMIASPWITPLIVPGFGGGKRELTIRLVRILFPGAGFLVASAWCLGVLNSHGKFLLSYTAPVAWNAAMIATLLLFGRAHADDLDRLALYLAWGSVGGSFLQLAVQWPFARALTRRGGPLALSKHVRQMARNFMPIAISRGAVQITGFIDQWIASFLPTGAVTGLTYAQQLYTLPVSLFGISVSASELPALSSVAARAETDTLRRRIDAALERLTFFTVPSAVAFAALGDVIAGTLLQTGRFSAADSRIVWGILAGSAIGLVASTQSRLYGVAHYALHDTKTPLLYALIRLVFVAVLGYVCALILPPRLGIAPIWGTAGLTASAGVSGWIEFLLLRASLTRHVGATGLPASLMARLWTAASLAGAAGFLVKRALPWSNPLARGAIVLPAFAVVYVAIAFVLRVPVLDVLKRGRR